MHPQDEPFSSQLKKWTIILLSTAGAIFLSIAIGLPEELTGLLSTATLIGMALYFTD